MTAEPFDLAALQARHRERLGQSFDTPAGVCAWDGTRWPCDAAALLSEVESLRAALQQIAALKPMGLFGFPSDELVAAQEIALAATEPAEREAE